MMHDDIQENAGADMQSAFQQKGKRGDAHSSNDNRSEVSGMKSGLASSGECRTAKRRKKKAVLPRVDGYRAACKVAKRAREQAVRQPPTTNRHASERVTPKLQLKTTAPKKQSTVEEKPRRRFSFQKLFCDTNIWKLRTRKHLVVFILVQFICGMSVTVSKFQGFAAYQKPFDEYTKCTAKGNQTYLTLKQLGLSEKRFEEKKTFLDQVTMPATGAQRTGRLRTLMQQKNTYEQIAMVIGHVLSTFYLRWDNHHMIQLGMLMNCLGYLLMTSNSVHSYSFGFSMVTAGFTTSYYCSILNAFDSMSFWMRALVFMAGELATSLGSMFTISLIYLLPDWTDIYVINFAMTALISFTIIFFIEDCYSTVLMSMKVDKIMKLFYLENTSEYREAMERLLEDTIYKERLPTTWVEYFKMIATNQRFLFSFIFFIIFSSYKMLYQINVRIEQIHLKLEPIEEDLIRNVYRAITAFISYAALRFGGLRFTIIASLCLTCVNSAWAVLLSNKQYDHCLTRITYSSKTNSEGVISDYTSFLVLYFLRQMTEAARSAATTIWFFELVPTTLRHRSFCFYYLTALLPVIGLHEWNEYQRTQMFGMNQIAKAGGHFIMIPLFCIVYRYHVAPVTFGELDCDKKPTGKSKRLVSSAELDDEDAEAKFHKEQG